MRCVRRWTDPFEQSGFAGYPLCALGAADSERSPYLRDTLTPAEQARLKRLKDDRKRAELEGSLILRRELIGALTECAPASVVISPIADGAPVLETPEGYSISISNKREWTFLAVDRAGVAIGVDAEIIRETNWRSMLDMICGEEERASFLAERAGDDVLPSFFRMWTVKEAILKATGEGFRAGPKNIRVPTLLYDGTAQGGVAAFGSMFDVWAAQADNLALSLTRKRS